MVTRWQQHVYWYIIDKHLKRFFISCLYTVPLELEKKNKNIPLRDFSHLIIIKLKPRRQLATWPGDDYYHMNCVLQQSKYSYNNKKLYCIMTELITGYITIKIWPVQICSLSPFLYFIFNIIKFKNSWFSASVCHSSTTKLVIS